MPRFTKKPVSIEARRFTNNNEADDAQMNELVAWIGGTAFHNGTDIFIPTLEGEMRAMCGDWIIRGVNGEFYPCKPEIFEATYVADSEGPVCPVVAETKQFRKDLDEILQRLKSSSRLSRERSLARTKIEEAIIWLGMDLKDQGTPSPYPHSKEPASPVIDRTTDGLRL
jgi:hypothetical protein